jgi:hypothetical protein
MSLDKSIVTKKFECDLEKAAENLVTLFGLRYRREGRSNNLNSALTRWLDFRFRYVEPRPRGVAYSIKFPNLALPDSASEELKRFEQDILTGQDLNPRQGRGLVLRHDTSGASSQSRTDALWADWGIFHFHLSADQRPGEYYFRSADYLVLCVLAEDEVGVIDVIRHPDRNGFAKLDFMETLHRSWPDYLEPYRLPRQGVAPRSLDEAGILALRSKNVNYTLTIDGVSYMSPGWGITSAGISIRSFGAEQRVRDVARVLAEIVCDPTSQFGKDFQQQGVVMPELSLVVFEGQIAVHESASQTLFGFQRKLGGTLGASVDMLYEMLLPPWLPPSSL